MLPNYTTLSGLYKLELFSSAFSKNVEMSYSMMDVVSMF